MSTPDNETHPVHGSTIFENLRELVIVLITAKTRILASGNDSPSLFTAPKVVAPLVMISSTKTIFLV